MVFSRPPGQVGQDTPRLTASRISISPEAAHGPYRASSGSIQIAGQLPWPWGRRARTSNRPNRQAALPRVVSFAELKPRVTWASGPFAPLRWEAGKAGPLTCSRRAMITSLPSWTRALRPLAV